MRTIKSILIIATIIAGVSFSSLAQQRSKLSKQRSPDVLVTDLYKQHKKRSPFFQTRNRALLDKYFDKELAALIWKDAITPRHEVGAIDGDPLYNAQDMDIKTFSIHKPTLGEGTAEVIVSFTNFGKPQEIIFLMVSARSGWKITNIKYSDGTDLLGILKGAGG